jgi:hypothetical protein
MASEKPSALPANPFNFGPASQKKARLNFALTTSDRGVDYGPGAQHFPGHWWRASAEIFGREL